MVLQEKQETAKVFLSKYKTLKEENKQGQQVNNDNRRRHIEDLFAEQKLRDEALEERQFNEMKTLLENNFKDELRLMQARPPLCYESLR